MQTSIGVQINASRELTNLPQDVYDEFLYTLQASAESLVRKAPANCSLHIDLIPRSGGYRIEVRLKSPSLNFSDVGDGRSPYVALENAMIRASNTIKVWAIGRRLD